MTTMTTETAVLIDEWQSGSDLGSICNSCDVLINNNIFSHFYVARSFWSIYSPFGSLFRPFLSPFWGILVVVIFMGGQCTKSLCWSLVDQLVTLSHIAVSLLHARVKAKKMITLNRAWQHVSWSTWPLLPGQSLSSLCTRRAHLPTGSNSEKMAYLQQKKSCWGFKQK